MPRAWDDNPQLRIRNEHTVRTRGVHRVSAAPSSGTPSQGKMRFSVTGTTRSRSPVPSAHIRSGFQSLRSSRRISEIRASVGQQQDQRGSHQSR
jgi:hypothetical protein